jgi:hypothetical protein
MRKEKIRSSRANPIDSIDVNYADIVSLHREKTLQCPQTQIKRKQKARYSAIVLLALETLKCARKPLNLSEYTAYSIKEKSQNLPHAS